MITMQGLRRAGIAGMLAAGISQAVAVPLLANMNPDTNSVLPEANQPTNPPLGSVNQTANPALPALNPGVNQMPTSLNQTTNPAQSANPPANPPLASLNQDTNRGFAPPLSGNSNQATNFGPGANQIPGTNLGFVETVLVTSAVTNASNTNAFGSTNASVPNIIGGMVTDARLINPWGLVVGPGVEWASDNGSDRATVYGAAGLSFSNFDINIPNPTNANLGGSNNVNFPPVVFATNGFNLSGTNNANTTNITVAGTNPLVAGTGPVLPGTNSSGSTNTVGGRPTGLVFNDTGQFIITNTPGTNSSETNAFGPNGVRYGPATFIVATESGIIAGWDYFVTGSNAVTVLDNSASNADYTGLAIAQLTNGAAMLYAANFHAGTVEMFNGNFQPVGSFTDTNLPAGYAPFNIKNIGDELFVTFAQQDTNGYSAVAGPGNGYVDVFAPDGTLLVSRFVSQGALNAPWGMALSPFSFGPFSNALLVGNAGDGRINAYDLTTGRLLGHLTRPDGSDLVIDGLWSLGFASELSGLDGFGFGTGQLYFTAGPANGTEGMLGTITFSGPSGSALPGTPAPAMP